MLTTIPILTSILIADVVGTADAAATAADATTRGPVAPAWLVLSIASLILLAVTIYTVAIQRSQMPASRRRIRTANGVMMFVLISFLSYALLLPVETSHRVFVLTWMGVIGLVAVTFLLALLDMLNTARLFTAERAAVAKESARQLAIHATKLAKERKEAADKVGGASAAHKPGSPSSPTAPAEPSEGNGA